MVFIASYVINNIEKVIGFSVGCSPLWADGKQTDKR